MDAEMIDLCGHFGKRADRRHPGRPAAGRGCPGEYPDLHPEPAGAVGDGAGDGAPADNAQDSTADPVDGTKRRVVPSSRPGLPGKRYYVPAQRHQQREGMLGYLVGAVVGNPAHDHAEVSGRLNVDVVYADAVPGNCLAICCRRQHRAADRLPVDQDGLRSGCKTQAFLLVARARCDKAGSAAGQDLAFDVEVGPGVIDDDHTTSHGRQAPRGRKNRCRMVPISGAVVSRTSPSSRNRGGSIVSPTPEGVPVKIRSPGRSGSMPERYSMSPGTVKIRSLVRSPCTCSPLTEQAISMLSRSANSSGVTR